MRERSDCARVVERKIGGYLALSPAGDSLQIGVVGESEEAAAAMWAKARDQWRVLLESGRNPPEAQSHER